MKIIGLGKTRMGLLFSYCIRLSRQLDLDLAVYPTPIRAKSYFIEHFDVFIAWVVTFLYPNALQLLISATRQQTTQPTEPSKTT